MREKKDYWSKERCLKESLKYTYKSEFMKNSPYVYEKARKNKWLDKICSHMIKKEKWTKEKCHEESLKYNSRKEYREKSPSSYEKSLNMKWLDEICSHMISIKKGKNHWTKENCKNEALKYENRSDFARNSVGSYCKAWEMKWLDEICSQMKIIGNRCKRCIYVYEFTNTKTSYIGLTFNIKSRNIQHMKRGPVFEYLKNSNIHPTLKQLTDYLDVEESKEKENFFIQEYINKGWKKS